MAEEAARVNARFYQLATLILAALSTYFAWDTWRNRAEAKAVQESAQAETSQKYQLQLPPELATSMELWRASAQELGEVIPYGGVVLPDTPTWQTIFPELARPGPIEIPELTLGWPNTAKIPADW